MFRAKRKLSIYIAVAVMFFALSTNIAHAATAQNYYGSEAYVQSYGETFNIGVYIESEDTIGDYEIYLSYDPTYLQYVSGATSGADGEILISGTANTTSIKVLLSFTAVAVGETTLTMASANIEADSDNSDMDIVSDQPIAPILIESVSGIYPQAIYIGDIEVEDFQSDVYEYTIELASTSSLTITDEDGDEIEALISTTVTDSGDVTVITADYQKGDESIIYTFNVTTAEVESDEVEEDDTSDVSSATTTSTVTTTTTSTSSGGWASSIPTGMDIILILVVLEVIVLVLTLFGKK